MIIFFSLILYVLLFMCPSSFYNEALLFYTFSFEQPIRNDTDGTKDIHDVPNNCAHG